MIVIPEQQKVDETVESTSLITDKKIQKKIESSSTSLEKDDGKRNSAIEIESDNDNSFLESDAED